MSSHSEYKRADRLESWSRMFLLFATSAQVVGVSLNAQVGANEVGTLLNVFIFSAFAVTWHTMCERAQEIRAHARFLERYEMKEARR